MDGWVVFGFFTAKEILFWLHGCMLACACVCVSAFLCACEFDDGDYVAGVSLHCFEVPRFTVRLPS